MCLELGHVVDAGPIDRVLEEYTARMTGTGGRGA
jgi:hypothetical protein